jgi:hypothetical protein
MTEVRLKTDDPLGAICGIADMIYTGGLASLDRQRKVHEKEGTWFNYDEARMWHLLRRVHNYIHSRVIEIVEKEPAPQCPSSRTH